MALGPHSRGVDGNEILVPSPPVPADFCHRTKGGNNSHCTGKTGNLLKIPHVNVLSKYYMHSKIFHSQICRSFPWGPRRKNPSPRESRNCQIHPHGIPATFTPMPADSRRPHPRAHLSHTGLGNLKSPFQQYY